MGKLTDKLKTRQVTDLFGLDLHVEKGERWLDKNFPVWFLHVTSSELDMAHQNHCILGQLLGSFAAALDSGKITGRQAVKGGFVIKQRKADRGLFPEIDFYDQLTAMWRKVVESRQAMHKACREEPGLRRKGLT